MKHEYPWDYTLTRPQFEREVSLRLDPWEIDENGIYRLRMVNTPEYRKPRDWAKEGTVKIIEIEDRRRGDKMRMHLESIEWSLVLAHVPKDIIDINVDGFIYHRNIMMQKKVAGYFIKLAKQEIQPTEVQQKLEKENT